VPLLVWVRIGGVRAAFSCRRGGVSGGTFASLNLGFRSRDDRRAVAENRRRLCAAVGAEPARTSSCFQVHADTVHHVDDDPPHAFDDPDVRAPAGDGLATGRPGRAVVVIASDCVPVVIARADGAAVAVCHAGWRGLVAGVVERTVAALGDGAKAAAVGPCAGPDCYEVRDDVRSLLRDRFGAAVLPGRRADLAACASLALADAGVATVDVAGLCTIADPERFFSYRRDGAPCGNQGAIAFREAG
jgi:YfiH family protein